MAFPTTPTNGQQATVGGITYQYNSSKNAWIRIAGTLANVGSLTLSGPINYTANAAVPKSYSDAVAIIFGF